MKSLLTPSYYFKDVYEINYKLLMEKGIKNIIFDIDNTLMPWGSNEANKSVKTLICDLKKLGFNICILSNGSKKRVVTFSNSLGVKCYTHGIKPMKSTLRGAVATLKGNTRDTCIIGDQMFTDILGGNRIKITTVLVDPLNTKELPTTRVIRIIEKIIKLQYEIQL